MQLNVLFSMLCNAKKIFIKLLEFYKKLPKLTPPFWVSFILCLAMLVPNNRPYEVPSNLTTIIVTTNCSHHWSFPSLFDLLA